MCNLQAVREEEAFARLNAMPQSYIYFGHNAFSLWKTIKDKVHQETANIKTVNLKIPPMSEDDLTYIPEL